MKIYRELSENLAKASQERQITYIEKNLIQGKTIKQNIEEAFFSVIESLQHLMVEADKKLDKH